MNRATCLGLIVTAGLFTLPMSADTTSLSCSGAAKQGGLLVCTGPAHTSIRVAGEDGSGARGVRTDADGIVAIGLTRHEASPLVLTPTDGEPISVEIATRRDDFRLLRGL
ncbi:MAG: hypothetical protein MK186_15050 [Henriciella sp.]|nr:hypothetical protein [Henriciella sp.]